MQKRIIRIGSRDSALAVEQSSIIIREIEKHHPDIQVELVTMKTTGDIILDQTLDKVGGKGLFVKELDQALAAGEIDLSVHSLKDMPMDHPAELPVVALSERADPRDVMVLPLERPDIPPDQEIGTSSARRKLQLERLYPNGHVTPVRGNILTRLKKLDDGGYSSLILAASGLNRLGLGSRIFRWFSPQEMIPAAGQGILAVQGRQGEDYSYLEEVHSKASETAALAERTFLKTLGGDCFSPTAAFAELLGNQLLLNGLYYHPKNHVHAVGSVSGDISQAEQLAEQLAQQLEKETA